jgi:glycosyltransferase involved in cell wall biosynthesis
MGHPVSVIVPAFNAARHILRAIDSVLEAGAAEVLVVDDCSTDATHNIVSGAVGRDERVRLVKLDRNSGPSAARNAGIQLANSDWVAVVDSDDWCAPDRFATLLSVASEFGADMVSDDQFIIEEQSARPWWTINKAAGWAHAIDQEVTFNGFLRSRHITKPMIRRSLLAASGVRYNEAIRHGEDLLFCCELLLSGCRWHMTPSAHYFYTVRSDSITGEGKFSRDVLRAIEVLQMHPAVAQSPELNLLCQKVVVDVARNHRIHDFRARLVRGDWRALAQALRTPPKILASIAVAESRLLPQRIRRRLNRCGSVRSGWVR